MFALIIIRHGKLFTCLHFKPLELYENISRSKISKTKVVRMYVCMYVYMYVCMYICMVLEGEERGLVTAQNTVIY